MKTLTKPPQINKAVRRKQQSQDNGKKKMEKNKTPFLNKSDYEDFIQIKKERTQKYNERSSMFFYVGLAISLFLISMAFDWKFYSDGDAIDLLGEETSTFEEVQDIPLTEQPPPPPPVAIQQPRIVEVPDEVIIEEVEIDLDVEMTEEMVVEEVEFEPEEEEVEEIFYVVENQPEPIGGYKAFYEFVGKSLRYPNIAARMGVEGRVYVRFVVGKDGNVTDAQVIKGIESGCDAEALRVIKASPKWKPGKQRGVPVKVYMTIPIIFSLKKPGG